MREKWSQNGVDVDGPRHVGGGPGEADVVEPRLFPIGETKPKVESQKWKEKNELIIGLLSTLQAPISMR